MAVTFQQCLQFLQKDQDRLPSSTNKIDPISATPAKLAYCCDLLYQHNEQKTLLGKHKDDPTNLPMNLLNFVAETLDIPKATDLWKTHPPIPTPSPASDNEGSSSPPSDEAVVNALPLLDLRALVYQGFDSSNLLPSSETTFYGATGRPVFLNAATKRPLTSLYLISARSLSRMNDEFWPVINALVDLTKFPGLSTVFPAAHAFQRLLILLATKTFHLHQELTQATALLGTSPLRTTDDLSLFIREITSFSTLDNILDRVPPFQQPKKIVDQVLHRLQRGSALNHFPLHVRSALDKILQELLASLQAGNTVEPSAILLRLAPYFPAPAPSLDQADTLTAMLARESTDSLASASNTVVQFDPPESAFLTRQDTGYGYRTDRRDYRPDPRPALRSDIRRDDRPASRQDLRGHDRPDSRTGSRLDESRSDIRPVAVDSRPESSTTLEDLQKLMQSLQSKLDKHVRQARPVHASPRAALMAHTSDSDEMAYTAFITDHHDHDGAYSTYPRTLGIRTTADSPPPQW